MLISFVMSGHFRRKKKCKTKATFQHFTTPADHSKYTGCQRRVATNNNDVVYLFSNDDDDENGFSEEETIYLRERTTNKLYTGNSNSFIEREISPGDSFVNLALRFGCSVAELKRINNVFQDQEIHALDKIKIPVQPFSVLTETNGQQATEKTDVDSGHCSPSRSCVSARTVSIGTSLLLSPHSSKEAFLRQMDEDLERLRKSTANYKLSLEEVAQELVCKRFHPLGKQLNAKVDHFRLQYVLFVGICVTFVIPLIIFLYFYFGKENQ